VYCTKHIEVKTGSFSNSLSLGCEGFAGFPGFFDILTAACLVPTMILGVEFAVFPSYWSLSLHSIGRNGSALRINWGVTLTTRRPRLTWFQTCRRPSCSAKGHRSICFRRGRKVWCAAPYCVHKGDRLATVALASFTVPIVGCVISSTSAGIRLLL